MKLFLFVLLASMLRSLGSGATNLPPSTIDYLVKKSCASLPPRMDGTHIHLTDYADEPSLHRVKTDEPSVTIESYRALNAGVAREIQKRGGTFDYVTIDPDKYFAWLKSNSLTNNAGNRAGYVDWLKNGSPKELPKTKTISNP